MIKFVLGITAILTFLLNLLLVYYLVFTKDAKQSGQAQKQEILNFVLTPTVEDMQRDTEILGTEIIVRGEVYVGNRGGDSAKKQI